MRTDQRFVNDAVAFLTDRIAHPTFDGVMRRLEVLKRHRVEFNTLSVVHRESACQPIEVYRFLKEICSRFLQFIPLVERQQTGGEMAVAEFTVRPDDYGGVFSCDHYVFPDHRLGNLLETNLGDLVRSQQQRAFGLAKSSSLPAMCRSCDVLFLCRGECPKNRFLHAPDGQPGLNYLCAAYQRFFRHSAAAMLGMAWLARNRRAPAEIMTLGVPGSRGAATSAGAL